MRWVSSETAGETFSANSSRFATALQSRTPQFTLTNATNLDGKLFSFSLSLCFFNFWLRPFSMLFAAFWSWNLSLRMLLFATFYVWNFPFRMLFATFGGWNLPFCKPCAAFGSWNLPFCMILAFVCNILELESSSGMLFTSCCCRLLVAVC